jgi:hypothetical protein
MVLQSGEKTVVLEVNEKFVIGCDEEEYDIVLNPGNIQRNEPHDAFIITARTDKFLKIAVVIKHNENATYSGLLHENELYATFDKDAIVINIETGELIRYEKDAVLEEYDLSELDELKELL